jgi:uncharacterized alpha-E superfamily protein
MLARIAQELFWLGRDLARAEHTARMLDGVFHADVAGAAGERGTMSWEELLAIIGEKAPGPAATVDTGDTADFEALTAEAVARRPLGRAVVASLLTLDTDSQASIVSCVARARERGHGLRDVMSTEMWEALNTFHLGLAGRDLSAALVSGPYSVYHDVKEGCALFWGLVARTMLRDEGHSFLEAGGRIEAADMVLRMLRVSVPAAPQQSRTEGEGEGEALALLHAVGGFQAYRRAVRTAPTVGPVARFLLYDSAYPGSVASAVAALHTALSTADALPRTSPPVLRLGRLLADLELQRRAPDAAAGFDETLERVQEDLELIEGDIEERYFAMAAVAAVHL